MLGFSRFSKFLAILLLIFAILLGGITGVFYFARQIVPDVVVEKLASLLSSTPEEFEQSLPRLCIFAFIVAGGTLFVSIMLFILSSGCKHKYIAKQKYIRESLIKKEQQEKVELSGFIKEYKAQFEEAAQDALNIFKEKAATLRCRLDYQKNDNKDFPVKVVFTFSIYGDNDAGFACPKYRKAIAKFLNRITVDLVALSKAEIVVAIITRFSF